MSVGASLRTYESGDTIFRQGDPADSLFLMLHGKVALEVEGGDRPPVTIQTIGRGEILGWSWLVRPHRWRLNARVVKMTEVLKLDGGTVRAALEERPSEAYWFLMRLLPVIAERLENTRLQLSEVHVD